MSNSRLMQREYFGEFNFTRQWNQAGRPEGVNIKNYPMGRFIIKIGDEIKHIPEELGYYLHTIDYYKQPKKQRLGFGKTPIDCEKIEDFYVISLEFPYYTSSILLKAKLITPERDLDIIKISECTEHTINCGEEFDWGDGSVTKEIYELACKKQSREIRKIAQRKYVADINLSDGQGGDDHFKNFENRLFRVLLEKRIDNNWDITLINRAAKIDLMTNEISSHPWTKNFGNGGMVQELELIQKNDDGTVYVIFSSDSVPCFQ